MTRSRGRGSAVLLALLVTLLLATACGREKTESPTGDAARGQALWAQSACQACHGAAAEGAEAGPALAHTPLSLHDVTSLVRRGTVHMPAFSAEQVSDQDLADMVAWFANPPAAGGVEATAECEDSCPAPATATGAVFGPAPTAMVAQNPWSQSECAGCHGASAEGGIGPALTGEDWEYAKFQRKVREGDEGMPAFGAGQLSDAELQAMYDWLRSLP